MLLKSCNAFNKELPDGSDLGPIHLLQSIFDINYKLRLIKGFLNAE